MKLGQLCWPDMTVHCSCTVTPAREHGNRCWSSVNSLLSFSWTRSNKHSVAVVLCPCPCCLHAWISCTSAVLWKLFKKLFCKNSVSCGVFLLLLFSLSVAVDWKKLQNTVMNLGVCLVAMLLLCLHIYLLSILLHFMNRLYHCLFKLRSSQKCKIKQETNLLLGQVN